MIPPILHHIWVGPNAMPQELLDYRESWRRHHPRWDIRLWTDENLPTDLVRKEAYERLRKPAERSDIIRLELLLRFGGVYVDTDIECLRSIEPLLEGVDFCMAYQKSGNPKKPWKVNNALIGARPGHAILERAVRELRPVTEYGLDKWGTGPYFLNKLIREYSEVTIFPPEYFYPTTPEERERAYTVHHGAFSWKDPEELRRGYVEAQRALGEARTRIAELERRRWKNRASRLAARFRRSREQAVR